MKETALAQVFPAGYFTGETTAWTSGGVILAEVRHAVSRAVPPHRHEAAYFSLLLEGSYAERGADFDLVYEPYTLVFHAAGTLHEDEIGERGCRFFSAALLDEWSKVIAELGGARAHVFELDGEDPVWIVLRLYREFYSRHANAEAAVEDLVYQLCTHVAQRSPEELDEPAWLHSVDASVRERFREAIDLRAIARQAGVHPAHLCRAYRRFRGRTLSDAMLGMRIQHVCRRLVESRDPLSAIALESGFADQSHMTRIFTRVTGRSPGAHRRQELANPIQA
jgi:AraC family transcriptional regulator